MVLDTNVLSRYKRDLVKSRRELKGADENWTGVSGQTRFRNNNTLGGPIRQLQSIFSAIVVIISCLGLCLSVFRGYYHGGR